MAVGAIKCCPYKLILMDVNMPVMDGHKSTRAIRKMFREYMEVNPDFKPDLNETMIVALTANDTAEDRKACLDAGMTDFLSKPPEQAELRKILKQALPHLED